MEEHSDRMERAYASRTLGELAGLTTDLVAEPDTQPVRIDAEALLAVFGNESRKGRWVVPERLRATSVFGDCHIDMREALLQSRVTTVEAFALFGAVTLIVPEGVRVRLAGPAVLGAKSSNVPEPSDPHAPLLDVRCQAYFGDVSVKSPRRKRWFDKLIEG